MLEAKLTDGHNEIMMALKSGRAIRFPEAKVRPTGRGAIGVCGIEVDDTKDEVVGMICVHAEDKTRNVLVVSENGYGKRTAVDEYRITNRGGKGVKTINITEKTGSLVGIMDVNETEDLIITCKSGVTLRTSLALIKESGRATQGVKLIRIDSKDSIAAISKIEEQEEVIPEGDVHTEGIIKAELTEGSEIIEDTSAIEADGTEAVDNVEDTENSEEETDN